MKRLTIIYNDTTLFDAEVDEFGWQDSDGQVAVSGKWRSQRTNGGGLLDLIGGASRQRTQSMVDRKRAEQQSDSEAVVDQND